ncbi:MAG: Lrp/AsnC ligand binding domain-containing protein [Nitrososphaerota archaeon]|nr:Lrp/AsnC ligand binding domain-containing protein [Nitrososphaerota archaeon]
MTMALVLINADIGRDKEVVDQLRKIEGVSEAYTVYGAYDIVVKVEAATQEKIKGIVFSKIRMLDYIRSTLTLVGAE